nr:hypothetical protein Iba_chr03dCG2690 [Ipomoea batatas]
MAKGGEQPNLGQQMTKMMRMLEDLQQQMRYMSRPQNQPMEVFEQDDEDVLLPLDPTYADDDEHDFVVKVDEEIAVIEQDDDNVILPLDPTCAVDGDEHDATGTLPAPNGERSSAACRSATRDLFCLRTPPGASVVELPWPSLVLLLRRWRNEGTPRPNTSAAAVACGLAERKRATEGECSARQTPQTREVADPSLCRTEKRSGEAGAVAMTLLLSLDRPLAGFAILLPKENAAGKMQQRHYCPMLCRESRKEKEGRRGIAGS